MLQIIFKINYSIQFNNIYNKMQIEIKDKKRKLMLEIVI